MDLITFIKSLGYIGVWGSVFLESGVLVFFFLPGDSLLFAVGFLAFNGFFDFWAVTTGIWMSAILGNMLGYSLGKTVGMKLLQRSEMRFIKHKHLEMAQKFYKRYGGRTVITARFMPIIRTFVPFLAGVALMPYKTFMIYNVIGAFLWAYGMTFLGYFFGKMIPAESVDQYILPLILMIIIISMAPSAYHYYVDRKESLIDKD